MGLWFKIHLIFPELWPFETGHDGYLLLGAVSQCFLNEASSSVLMSGKILSLKFVMKSFHSLLLIQVGQLSVTGERMYC